MLSIDTWFLTGQRATTSSTRLMNKNQTCWDFLQFWPWKSGCIAISGFSSGHDCNTLQCNAKVIQQQIVTIFPHSRDAAK